MPDLSYKNPGINPTFENTANSQDRLQKQPSTHNQPKPDAWQLHQQPIAKTKPETPSASTYPYNNVGQLAKPISDTVIDKFIEPAARTFANAVKNKQPIGIAEHDLLNTSDIIKNTIADTYTKNNTIKAMNALHEGNTLGRQDDMTNPDTDALKGFQNTWDETQLGLAEIRQMGNKLFDPEETYLPAKQYGQWIKEEKKRLKTNTVPELMDFTRLDWKNNPDKVIELGGKYFRQSLLGTHLFGFAADAIKGRAGPIANQIIGTVTGIARFYNTTDDILASIPRGAAASSGENWDFVIGKLTTKLPFMSRQALQFMNSVLTKNLKAKMFDAMMAEYKAGKIYDPAQTRAPRPSNTQKSQP